MTIIDIVQSTAVSFFESSEDCSFIRPPQLCFDSFIARSAMQKAIRRGDKRVALSAAAALLPEHRAVLWRRLIVTALEDLGVMEVEKLLLIAGAIEARRFGFQIEDEWPLITKIIEACCAGTRCQAANDLHNLALNKCEYDAFKLTMTRANVRDRLKVAADPTEDLVERYIAVLTCLGAHHAPWTMHRQDCEHEVILSALSKGVSPELCTLYGWAYRKTRVPLAWSSMLLLSANGGHSPVLSSFDDEIPSPVWINGIPSYALDQYTRSGKAALRRFVATNNPWLGFADRQATTLTEQRSAAGELLFRAEGAVVTRRASWDIARVLFDQSKRVGCFLPESAVDEGLSLIRAELSELNRLRSSVLRQ